MRANKNLRVALRYDRLQLNLILTHCSYWKIESYHDADFAITHGSICFHNDNLWYQ